MKEKHQGRRSGTTDYVSGVIACVAGVQRGGRRKVECEREARSFGARFPTERPSDFGSTCKPCFLCSWKRNEGIFVKNIWWLILQLVDILMVNFINELSYAQLL